MGYMRHHAIVVTCYDEDLTKKAHGRAEKIWSVPFEGLSKFRTVRINLVSPIIEGVINGYSSFFVAPDGSKEGWAESQDNDTRRNEFIEWLREQRGIDWAEIQYGDEMGETIVTAHSDEEKEEAEEEQ